MQSSYKVSVLVGSLRKDSISLKLAHALEGLAPERLKLEVVEIRDLPLYNPDLEENVPEAWAAFRRKIAASDAVLFVTPEYNRSVPGALKNALDVGSRPYGKSAWSGKPAGIVSISPGALAAFGANHHLRQSLVFLDMPAMQQPEAYIGNAAALFDQNGSLVNESTTAFLRMYMKTFERWIDRVQE
jgi:chromate reductase, NAD(P)H dehydrogenase (quinone)